jgi:peroxiredoxin
MIKINPNYRSLYLALLAGLIYSCNSSYNTQVDGYEINAHISGLQDGEATLMQLDMVTNEPVVINTARIENGRFRFDGTLAEPFLHTILINSEPLQHISLFIENSRITITGRSGDLDRVEISGSREDSLFRSYTQDEIFEKGPGMEIMLNHPDYIFAAFVAYYQFQLHNYSLDTMTMIMNAFSEAVQRSEYYRHLVPLYNNLCRVSIGQPAPEFKLPNQESDTIALTDFRGQYVFLDFWASWCKPCRAANPNLVKAYNELKHRNFEIIGISIDNNRHKWLAAIEQDRINWVQLSNLQGWDTVSATYGVKAIPQNFLINPDGFIIDKNIPIAELATKLSAILPE